MEPEMAPDLFDTYFVNSFGTSSGLAGDNTLLERCLISKCIRSVSVEHLAEREDFVVESLGSGV